MLESHNMFLKEPEEEIRNRAYFHARDSHLPQKPAQTTGSQSSAPQTPQMYDVYHKFRTDLMKELMTTGRKTVIIGRGELCRQVSAPMRSAPRPTLPPRPAQAPAPPARPPSPARCGIAPVPPRWKHIIMRGVKHGFGMLFTPRGRLTSHIRVPKCQRQTRASTEKLRGIGRGKKS